MSRRKGQAYLTVIYDLERRVLLWVGEDRTKDTVRKFFNEAMGQRRCRTLRVVCMDMWAPYREVVREQAPSAQILFDAQRPELERRSPIAEIDDRQESASPSCPRDAAALFRLWSP